MISDLSKIMSCSLSERRYSRYFSLLIAAISCTAIAANKDILENPASSDGSRVEYLDNGTVRIGIDLSIGGAITCFAASEMRHRSAEKIYAHTSFKK